MPELSHYMLKKLSRIQMTYVITEGVNVKKLKDKIVRLKVVPKYKVLPHQLSNMQFLYELLRRQGCGPGIYRVCPRYYRTRGVFSPTLTIELAQTEAKLYEPTGAPGQWRLIKRIILT